ncbi:MAG: DoxX family protein, partial [candidate division CPR2 bacterium GW2011_GWD1_39_7]
MEKRLLVVVQLIISLEWLKGGWEKVTGGEFVGGMEKTLGYFASKNPFGLYKSFLSETAIPNATAFGIMVSWGELLSGLILALAALTILLNKRLKFRREITLAALIVVMVMNANFWLAAKWTSPAVDGLNLIMF